MRGFCRLGLGVGIVGVWAGCALDFPEIGPPPAAPANDAAIDATESEGGPDASTPEADAPGALADFVSGARLRANVFSGDGARLFASWHDTTLDADCQFAFAEDGKLRCVPVAVTTTAFSDPACTTPLLELQLSSCNACGPPKYVTTGEACGQKVYPAGGVVRADTLYRRSPAGPCVEQTATNLTTIFRAVGPKVDPTTLVEVVTSTVPRGDGLGIARMVAADGAELTKQVVDVARDAACAPASASESVTRCTPSYVALKSNFNSDASCATPIASTPTDALLCGAPPSAVVSNDCDVEYSEIGAEYTGPRYHVAQSECTTNLYGPPGLAKTWFEIGPTLSPAAFPSLEQRREGGGAQLQTNVLTTTTGTRLMPSSFFDMARGVPCKAALQADTLRCVPDSFDSAYVLQYADSACTTPLYRHAGCPSVPRVVSVAESSSTRRLGLVGAEVTPDRVFYNSDGSCKETGKGSDRYYALSLLDPDTFPVVTRTTE